MLVTFIFCLLFGKVAYIQLLWNKELQARALDQWTRDIPLVARRGAILDINGVVLADTSTQYTLYIRPNAVSDAVAVSYAISEVLGINYDKVYKKVTRSGVSEVTITKGVSTSQMTALKNYGYSGMYYSQDLFRYYPYGDFMSQILGFTDYDTLGQSGLELYYNSYLTGINGSALSEADLVGRELGVDTTYYLPSVDGMNVTLTIDYYIQALAENAVKQALAVYDAKSVSCVILSPSDGAVLAMATSPSMNLNSIDRSDVTTLFELSKSPIVSSVYEPGSTFKILTTAIGLETGAVSDSYSFFCPGYRIIDGQRIKCWRTKGHGSQVLGEGICNSCNCLFMDIATKVGTTEMYEYFRSFGLTEKTGIDFLGEASGLLIAEESAKTVDVARMGFGQAIAITPLELITAVCSVINGGTKVTPYLLSSVSTNEGLTAYSHNSVVGDRIISTSTSTAMRNYLRAVVEEGSGSKAAINGYSVGGKTGTAQKYENGTIAAGKYVSSFVGFMPVDNPQYACLFIVDEPQGYLYYGSIVAAPYVNDIFEGIINYKGLLPDMPLTSNVIIDMPTLVGMSLDEAVKTVNDIGLCYEVEGEGTITYQYPSPQTQVAEGGVVFIKAE